MCDDDPGFTTLLGPRYALQRFITAWPDLETTHRFEMSRPRVVELASLGPEFLEERAPQVAVVEHAPGDGPRIAAALQTELLIAFGAAILTEPGFLVRPATGVPGDGATVTLDPSAVSRARDGRPNVTRVDGRRVALLDSGDSHAVQDSVVFTTDEPHRARMPDAVGHGTAVGDLVRALQPAGDIHPVNVIPTSGVAHSYQLLSGLIYCLWSRPGFDIVNASLTTQAAGPCPSALGRSVAYAVGLCAPAASGRGEQPVVVAAAGNRPATTRIGYPALLPDAIVVTALDWAGAAADYNVPVPGWPSRIIAAPGGTREQPYGHSISVDGAVTRLYGTSFAAALVTAALLPRA